ncbi:hypothetical protein [Paenibacillus sp. LjRoot56]|uniref:hypothetical protein n=1 Tax=Paenibacillus sp. LjRoot56 TaxID=3342333 RepID=UPI003ECD204E
MNKPNIIDTDVHNAVAHSRDLLPYLPKVWHDYWLSAGPGYGGGWHSPVGVMRKDAVPDGGGIPGSDPQHMLKHHFNKYGIDYEVRTWFLTWGLLRLKQEAIRCPMESAFPWAGQQL